MSKVYIFRGKAASGKSTLSNKLGKELGIPVLCKDDILEPIKVLEAIEDRQLRNQVCFSVLQRLLDRSIGLGADVILDVGLGDKGYAEEFIKKFDFSTTEVIGFSVVCKDLDEWKRRHELRIKNPLPSQSFTSFEHVLSHYEKMDDGLLKNEYLIDTSENPDECFENLLEIIKSEPNALIFNE